MLHFKFFAIYFSVYTLIFLMFPLFYEPRAGLCFDVGARNPGHFTSFVVSSRREGTACARRGRARSSPLYHVTWRSNEVAGVQECG